MNKKIIFHLVLISFASNLCAMSRVRDLVGWNTYPCEFKGQSTKQGTIALRAREKSAVHKNIDQFSYDVKTDKATLKFKGESVELEGASLDGFMDYLSKLSHYSDVSVKTTIGNNSVNWQFSGGEYPRNAVALHSMNKCKQGISSLNGVPSDGKILDVTVTREPQSTTGTLSLISSPYLPGSRLCLTSDADHKQNVLIDRNLVELLYNVCKATAMYNNEKESNSPLKSVVVKAAHSSSGQLRVDDATPLFPEFKVELLAGKVLPVMEQWFYAQKVKKYIAVSFAALLAVVSAYLYKTSNAQ